MNLPVAAESLDSVKTWTCIDTTGESTQPNEVCADELFSSMKIPLLNPSNRRSEAFLFCFAKQIALRFPDVERCTRCRSNSCLHHENCSTVVKAGVIRKDDFSPDKARVVEGFQKLLVRIGLAATDDGEVNFLMVKCNGPWKNLVVNCILYEFENFPVQWHEYI